MFLVMSIMQMNQIENKPWGSYEVLLDEPNYKVKRIVVDAYQRFSLQYHKHREEHWVIVDGSGCLLYTSPSPRDGLLSRMPSSA